MAFDPNNLSCVSYANGFTMWHYRTPDPWAVVTREGYFDQFPHVRVGDIIATNASVHDRTVTGFLAVVSVVMRDVVVAELVAPVGYSASAEPACLRAAGAM